MTPKPIEYVCGACGRRLSIRWVTRSVICSCGAKVLPAEAKD
jgi:DNA-directed RNA polymerase subunit RPC12/RpoP